VFGLGNAKLRALADQLVQGQDELDLVDGRTVSERHVDR